jgi:hypothetical protein
MIPGFEASSLDRSSLIPLAGPESEAFEFGRLARDDPHVLHPGEERVIYAAGGIRIRIRLRGGGDHIRGGK